MSRLKWIFDEEPPSGEQQGGDLARKAFSLDLNTFVREVLQNSKDANNHDSLPNGPAEVIFKLIEISGERVSEFLNSLEWESLSKHLKGGAYNDYKFMLKEIEKLEFEQRLRLLLIEDSNTTGLYGGEKQKNTPFKSLVKDKLFSTKDDQYAGGSHGLGKSVLWGFSAFSTVFFYSKIKSQLAEEAKFHRFLARTAIPSHEIVNQGYTGSGWFGKEITTKKGSYATSIFGTDAKIRAQQLLMDREDESPGTSILVFGFREPIRGEEREAEEIISDLKKASAEWFWPTICRDDPGLIVKTQYIFEGEKHEVQVVDPYAYEDLRPLIKAYNDYLEENTVSDLKDENDTVLASLPIEIPSMKEGGHEAFTGSNKLLVRLADNGSEKTNKVAIFRGQGMIIDYLEPGQLALDAQNYYGVFVAGTAAGSTEQDEHVEQFLRLAEPPEHTAWTSTEKLRDNYHTPYKKPLDKLKADLKKVLRSLVTKNSESEDDVPPELLKRFRLGSSSGGFIAESEFKIDIDASVKDGRWIFNSLVKPKNKLDKDWRVKIYPRMSEEDSKFNKGDLSLIEEIEASANGTKIEDFEVNDGYLSITVPQDKDHVYIKGITNPESYPLDMELSSFELRIEGEK
jgi:hypothetical protein